MSIKRFATKWILAMGGSVCLAVGTWSAEIPYRTGFESPTFAVGALGTTGQDGWTGTGEIQNTSSQGIRSGTQSLQINQTSVVTREMTSPTGGRAYLDGYYFGATVNTLPDPSAMEEGSALIIFHETQGIMALNGNGTGGGTWVATGVAASTSTLQRITLALDFATHTWTLYVDKKQVPSNSPQTFGFKNNTINQLNGIDIETSSSGKGYLDDFSATTSVPEFFREAPFDFSSEWKLETTGTPNWDLVNDDDQVGADDLIEFITRVME